MYLYYVFVYEAPPTKLPSTAVTGSLGGSDVRMLMKAYTSHARARVRAQAHLHGGDKRKHGPVSHKRGAKAFCLIKHEIGHEQEIVRYMAVYSRLVAWAETTICTHADDIGIVS
jgi:hypothetical protein